MKLLITGAWNADDTEIQKLCDLGYSVCYMQDEKGELSEDVLDADGIICNGLFLYHDVKQFSNLKFIQLTSAGLDRVPIDYCNEKGIQVFSARGVYSIPMAEFAMCGVLQILKNSRTFYDNQKNALWQKDREITELFGKTVAIIGCGSVGDECAKRFSAFGCKVIGVDIFINEKPYYSEMVKLDRLDDVLSKSDVIILTLPLTKETVNLFDSKRFNKIKTGAILVNIARGRIADENALIDAISSKLLGAVLDVFETEPLSKESPLWSLKKVILTPHNSFVSDGNKERLFNVIISNLEKVL